MRKHFVLKSLVSLLIIAFVLNHFALPSSLAYENPSRSRVIVSIGDSYSAGEGNEPFYGENLETKNKIHNQDWLAHRSKNAWPGYLYFPETDLPQTSFMNNYKESDKSVKWFFAASSGATTEHYEKPQKKTYSQGDYSGTEWVAAQKLVFQKCRAYGVEPDYVTLTLGGNDAGFVDILITAAMTPNFLKPTNLTEQINDIWDDFKKENGIRDSLKKVYKSVDEETDHKSCIIVAGYPQLINPKGSNDYLFSAAEAKVINDAVTDFNGAIAGIVGECYDEGMDICFANVAPYFKGHEAYTDEPYINPVLLTAMPEDLHDHICDKQIISAYSMHPNYIRETHSGGVIAYANCVQNIINDRETRKYGVPLTTETTPSETPTAVETTVPTTLVPLTDDQAVTAIKNYLYEELGYDEYVGEAPWYLDIDEKSNSSTAVVFFRAYTAAISYFYIDRISGETHEKVYLPNMTLDVDEPLDGVTFNARDYLNAYRIGKTEVKDAYKQTTKNQEGYKVTDRIPKVTVEGLNTDAVNKEIFDTCKPILGYGGSSYEYYIGKTYVSIIIYFEPVMSDPQIKVFNVSRLTGKFLSKEEMLDELDLTIEEFESRTKKAIENIWSSRKPYLDSIAYSEYEEAISEKTIRRAIPCVNKNGKVCFYIEMLPDGYASDYNDHVDPI